MLLQPSVKYTSHIWLQIDGPTLRDMDMGVLSQMAPEATRAECKLLLRSTRDMETSANMLLQLSTTNEGLLHQLNMWFPGKFRAAVAEPLYAHDDTTVVQATHKVSSIPMNALTW